MRIFALKDPGWYRCQGLPNDCSLSGGCCDLKCGFCGKRAGHMDLEGINGHYTWASRCCIERKGVSFKDYNGDNFEKQYKDALGSANSILLLRMTVC